MNHLCFIHVHGGPYLQTLDIYTLQLYSAHVYTLDAEHNVRNINITNICTFCLYL